MITYVGNSPYVVAKLSKTKLITSCLFLLTASWYTDIAARFTRRTFYHDIYTCNLIQEIATFYLSEKFNTLLGFLKEMRGRTELSI